MATALGALLLTATGLMPLVGVPSLSADSFVAVWPDLLLAARESLVIAVAATTLSVTVGFAVALLLLTTGSQNRLLTAAVATPVPIAHLVGAASFGLLLADTGLANRIVGTPPDQWPSLVGGPWPVATVAAFAWKESAFTALVVTAALAPSIRDYTDAAKLLGASATARARHVVLPLAAPALVGAGAIVFCYTVGSYEVVWLLGRAYPETLPVSTFRLFGSIDVTSRPQAAATALATTALALVAACAALPLVRRGVRPR
ncbi:ABC transporter permease [Terracoccus luteus]|uniref:Putative spermidine/putrescine transport system permease protein n=1 Tax=Terracoccus luteus TaxID=53356 RepID=A0A839PZE9_9MICO|nr:ABC transporter permease subunit [Terracoccus luteus]MBB2988084.1 putative spermidine/putrescine transport system permease protein [Terracoccus luteus]MCP2173735.1 putative spermidine/putrescine transport system permease protein [Terracoccus luteus]